MSIWTPLTHNELIYLGLYRLHCWVHPSLLSYFTDPNIDSNAFVPAVRGAGGQSKKQKNNKGCGLKMHTHSMHEFKSHTTSVCTQERCFPATIRLPGKLAERDVGLFSPSGIHETSAQLIRVGKKNTCSHPQQLNETTVVPQDCFVCLFRGFFAPQTCTWAPFVCGISNSRRRAAFIHPSVTLMLSG